MKIDCDSSLLQCANCTSPIMHLICPSSPPPRLPPKIAYPLFFISPAITAVSRELENNAYEKFWGQIRCIMGDVQVGQ